MSSLNSEATKELLLESDILASSGKLDSIWELYTKNVTFQNGKNDLLKLILSSVKTNVIDKLNYGNDNLGKDVDRFQSFVGSVSQSVPQNSLTTFLIALSSALTDYADTNNESATNIQINMSECASDVSIVDESTVVSLLERYGLLDSSELGSLLDDGTSALMTACDSISRRCGNSPSTEGSDVHVKPMSLTFQSFIPHLDEVIRCCELVSATNGVDQFPETPYEIAKLISGDEKLLGDRLYHQGSYLTNQANLKIVTATAQCIASLSDMDTATAIYALSSVNEKLNEMKKETGSASCIVYSQMVVTAMLIRYLYLENEGEKPFSGILNEKYLRYKGVVSILKKRVKELLDEFDHNRSSVFDNEAKLFGSTLVDDYVQFVEEPNPYSVNATDENRRSNEPFRLSDDDLSAALNELLLDLGDVLIDAQATANSADSSAVEIGAMEALSSLRVEQVTNAVDQSLVTAIVECGTAIHEELNKGLLGNDLESAANGIAREMALSSLISESYSEAIRNADEVRSVKECIERDVSTYMALCEASVPGGISKYEQSARSYVNDLLKTV